MDMIHCGLCNVKVDNWNKHVASKQHQDNLRDRGKITKAVLDSQAAVRGDAERFVEGREKSMVSHAKCVCRFSKGGKCLAEEGYMCPMEHDVEGLIRDIVKVMVDDGNGKLSDSCAVSQTCELVKAYLLKQR